MPSPSRVAFVSAGSLFAQTPDGALRELPSAFASEYIQRAQQLQRKHAWKAEGRGARFMSGGMLWGSANADPGRIRIVVKGLTRAQEPGRLLYALDTDGVSGLFARELSSGEERRLYHSADTMFHHLSGRPASSEVAMSLLRKNGTSCIALFDDSKTAIKEITEGDTVDLAPSWHPGGARRLVFQSAGVGRDAAGEWAGLAPFSIQELDLDGGSMQPLLEEPDRDYLNPRLDAHGALYAISRPHGTPGASGGQSLLDTLLIPFRLATAVFQYLNFFTAMYTGKPLTSAGLPRRPGQDLRHLMIWGNVVDAEEAAREARQRGEEHPALVPASWELIRRGPDGARQVLAQGVLSFDLEPDGSAVYSNGSAIYRVERSGTRTLVLSHANIEQVVALQP